MRESANEVFARARERILAEEVERIRPEIERRERRIDGVNALKAILEAKIEKADQDKTMSVWTNIELHEEIYPQIRALERVAFEEWHEIGNLFELKYQRTEERVQELPEYKAMKRAYLDSCAAAAGMDKVRDYQNGHVTGFDEYGEVIYEEV